MTRLKKSIYWLNVDGFYYQDCVTFNTHTEHIGITHSWVHSKKHGKYRAQFIRQKYCGYLGSCICPKCGKEGYMELYRAINLRTKTECPIFKVVNHQHTEKGRTVHDGKCYLGRTNS